MSDFKLTLRRLQENLNTLRERESKYGGNAPLDLLNQITDHQKAIDLTRQAITGELTEAEWREAVRPLLLALSEGQVVNIEIDTGGGAYVEGTINTGGGDFVGRNKVSISQQIVNIFTGPADQRHQRNRDLILEKVRQFWIEGVLEKSLANGVLIDLGLVEKREAIDNPWAKVIQVSDQPDSILSVETKLVDVFNQVRSLLILGEPGSGKTTMLLELARYLIGRAETDHTQPIPVIFNLSSWPEKHLPLAGWLVEELNTKYQIPKKVAQMWIENDELLLLLDGLDEVAQQYRAGCVEMINSFLQESLMSLVVCSRIADYEATPTKLSLERAVVLQPLSPQQIEHYLARAEAELLNFQTLLAQDSILQELTRSPLILNIMTLAYENILGQSRQLPTSLEGYRYHLLEAYVNQAFKRRGANSHYPPEETKKRLSWLAGRMVQHNQTILLIEQIQPSWLVSRVWRWGYVMSSRVLAAVAIQLGIGLSTGFYEGVVTFLELGLIIGSLVGLVDVLRFEWYSRIGVGPTNLSGRQALIHVLGISLLVGMTIAILAWLTLNLPDTERIEIMVRGGFAQALLAGLFFGLRGRRQSVANDIQTTELLSWSWRKMVRGGLLGLVVGLIVGVSAGLIYGLGIGASDVVVDGLIFGLFGLMTGNAFGGLSRNQVASKTVPNQGMRLSLRNAVLTGLIFGVFGMFVFILVNWLIVSSHREITLGVAVMEHGGSLFFIAACVGLLTALWFGGLDLIQHYTLRFILWWQGHLVWDLVPFLDYCVDRIFLRKVGGGYIFIHRYLMEYFASLTPEDIERLSSEIEPKKAQPA